MPFALADLIITVIKRAEFEDTRPTPPIPASQHFPTEVDELIALFQHGLALLEEDFGAEMRAPRTLAEAVALEQHLLSALREIRELKAHLASSDTRDTSSEKKST
jgi:hypothetical protein